MSYVHRAPAPGALPGWPLLVPLSTFIAWWALGVGDFIWLAMAAVMAVYLIRARATAVPRFMWVWVAFLGWVVVSLAMVEGGGRVLGALYRLGMYAAAGVIAVYVLNTWRTLPWRSVSGVMVLFLANMTAGGLLAMAAPELTIHTPLSHLMPAGLLHNELVHDMVVRRTSQWNPDAWVVLDPRPAAPFLYANTWGSVYPLVLCLAASHLTCQRDRWRRRVVLAVIGLSLVPASATLNRGMLLGLGVAGAWWVACRLRAGAREDAGTGMLLGFTGAVLFLLSGGARAILDRLAASSTTGDRAQLYEEVLDKVAASPAWGFGAPRPSAAGLPSVGTQGQVWTVLFSHGWVGLVLFVGFLAAWTVLAWRRLDRQGALAGAAVAATLVECTFYGMATGLMVTMVAIGLLARGSPR